MFPLAGKTMVVIGGSRGVGRRIAESGARQGAQVLAVARHKAALRQLAQDVAGIEVLALDASRPNAPSEVFGAVVPDILVLGGGAIPVTAPLHEQSWRDFTVNWESDVRIAFHFCKAALSRPLPAGLRLPGDMPEPNERRCSSRITARRNPIALDSACNSSRLLPASFRRQSSESLRSMDTLVILGCPRMTSFEAWHLRRPNPTLPTRSSNWRRARISPRERCSSLLGRDSKRPPYVSGRLVNYGPLTVRERVK